MISIRRYARYRIRGNKYYKNKVVPRSRRPYVHNTFLRIGGEL